MRAIEYKNNFVHMMAQGATSKEALENTLLSFIKEYNAMLSEKASGTMIFNALRQQNDKWKAFARKLPNYGIKEDGFMISLKLIKPELYNTYITIEQTLKEMRKR